MRAPARQMTRRAACGAGLALALLSVSGCSSGSRRPQPTARSTSEPPGASTTAPTTASSTTGSAVVVHAGQLVVSGPVSRERLQSVAGEAADAVRRVRQVWGSEVLRHTLTIQVAATDEQFRNAGGGAEEGAQIAATTTANGAVVLAPVLFTKVTAPGQVVVLTHELTHVALGQGALTGVPRWVIEGSAEFTAYAGSAKSLAVIAPQLATAVRTGSLPAGAPPDDRFVQDPVAAYQEALAWCRFLAERFGRSTFVSFVRAADAGTPRAFETAFGSSATSLRAPYAIYLHARLR